MDQCRQSEGGPVNEGSGGAGSAHRKELKWVHLGSDYLGGLGLGAGQK